MTTTETSPSPSTTHGAGRLSPWLWLAIGAAAVQLTAIASDFYSYGDGNIGDAWFGIPHTADLIVGSAVVTVALAALLAGRRNPMSGRGVGITIGVIGLLATAQLVYRMVLPPFGGCLTFTDCASARMSVELLPGIWFALIGCVGAALGGLGHAMTSRTRKEPANFWVADSQSGMTPLMATGAVAAAVAFIVGYGGFGFYKVAMASSGMGGGGAKKWSGWISSPHTSSLVLVLAIGTVLLVWAAARKRAPMGPSALGATMGVLGFAAATRILYRILVPPFYSAARVDQFQQGAEIQITAWIAFVAAVVWFVAGVAEAISHRESATRTVREPASGTA